MNLVPLVDMALNLVLILLIMASGNCTGKRTIYIAGAMMSKTKTDVNDWIRVTLAEDERLSVDGDLVASWAELPAAIRDKRALLKKDFIILEVDKAVPYRTTSRLLDLVQANGATRVAFATKQNRHEPVSH
jgi:biopolymer transport protein ExbD